MTTPPSTVLRALARLESALHAFLAQGGFVETPDGRFALPLDHWHRGPWSARWVGPIAWDAPEEDGSCGAP